MPKWYEELERSLDEIGKDSFRLLNEYERRLGKRPASVSVLRAGVQKSRIRIVEYLLNHRITSENPITLFELSTKVGVGTMELKNALYPDVKLSPATVGAVSVVGERYVYVRQSNQIFVGDSRRAMTYLAIMRRLVTS